MIKQLDQRLEEITRKHEVNSPDWDELLRVVNEMESNNLLGGGAMMASTLREYISKHSSAIMQAYRAYKGEQRQVLAEKLEAAARERLCEFSMLSLSPARSPPAAGSVVATQAAPQQAAPGNPRQLAPAAAW